MTAEEVYALYHKEWNRAAGRNVRAVKNFENPKAKEGWKHFELFASFIERNNGNIDPTLYMRALSEAFEGWFKPELLCKPKANMIYRKYLEELKRNTDCASIRKQIIESISFVVRYCHQKSYSDIYEYLNEDIYLIPSVLKHLHAGSLSIYFLVCFDTIKSVFQNYPQDCVREYVPNFTEEYQIARIRLLGCNDLDELRKNIDKVCNQLIEKEAQKDA
jgi:hypothetical protein